MTEPPTRSKLWATVALDDSREVSVAGALMLLALDDLRNARDIDAHAAVGVWRRYCASNLVYAEWRERAWRRGDADKQGGRALRELSDALCIMTMGRIHPTSHHLLADLRKRFKPAMPVREFIAYATKTHEKVTGRFAR